MKRLTTLMCAALLGAGVWLSAGSADARDMAWIHEVNLLQKTVTLGPAGGTEGTVYHVTDQTQLSGPEGALSLSELPSMQGGSMPDITNVVFESAEGGAGSILYELQLLPQTDQ